MNNLKERTVQTDGATIEPPADLFLDLEALGTERMRTVLMTGSMIGRLLTTKEVDAIFDDPKAAGRVLADADLAARASVPAPAWAPATKWRNIAGVVAVWSEMRHWPLEAFEELHASGADCRQRWFGSAG